MREKEREIWEKSWVLSHWTGTYKQAKKYDTNKNKTNYKLLKVKYSVQKGVES